MATIQTSFKNQSTTKTMFNKKRQNQKCMTYPAQAEDRQWVKELSFKFVFFKMAIFTESYVDKSPRLTNAARCTFGAQPRQSPKIPFCARIFLKLGEEYHEAICF